MTIPVVTLVEILPTKVWVEDDLFGSRHVMLQHEGFEPFNYASFYYNYAYTSNAGTWDAANRLAVELGATEPVEHRNRPFPSVPVCSCGEPSRIGWTHRPGWCNEGGRAEFEAGVGINGLTEAETSATASVMGIAATTGEKGDGNG